MQVVVAFYAQRVYACKKCKRVAGHSTQIGGPPQRGAIYANAKTSRASLVMWQGDGLNLREKVERFSLRVEHVRGLNSGVGDRVMVRFARDHFGVFKWPSPRPSAVQMVRIRVR